MGRRVVPALTGPVVRGGGEEVVGQSRPASRVVGRVHLVTAGPIPALVLGVLLKVELDVVEAAFELFGNLREIKYELRYTSQ